jgi:predicted transcriptional regulator|tara:strand:+ start:548 stop:964 length:417 start_codon:yes stop_codon:yes gene_type:complete
MNLSFADTLYFKKENTLEIILGLHRSYKSLQREIQICCELNNLTFNELIVILEIKKGFKKKIDIANKVFLKKQNLNLILKDLQIKNILNLDKKTISITKNGEELIEKTTNRINEKIIKIFKKIDPKNMSGFINIIESL